MLSGILLLAVVVFGISILFGRSKPATFGKFLIWLVFAPTVLAIGFYEFLSFWSSLPLALQMLSLLAAPFFIAALLRLAFPKAKWLHQLQEVVFQALVYLVTFPFRFLWRAGRLIFERERRSARLNPHRPAVGARPPLAEHGRERREQRHDPFDW